MKKGFTLLEMLLTITIIAVLAGISTPIYMSFMARNELNITSSIVVQSLRRAQALSRAMENNQSWGVSLGEENITIFNGANYSSRDTSYDETFEVSPMITFSGVTEVVFTAFTGETTNYGDININSDNNDTKTITINQKGMVDF